MKKAKYIISALGLTLGAAVTGVSAISAATAAEPQMSKADFETAKTIYF